MAQLRILALGALLSFSAITPTMAQSDDGNQIYYKIITGQFEKGSPEQKSMYSQLFGAKDIQHKFDIYFHWFNIAHEYGHCILDFNNKSIGGAKEEISVNKYAVSYWKHAGFGKEIIELKNILENALATIPNPVPEDKTFIEWYTDIWGTPQLMTVPVYGYFQFKSVLIAMEDSHELSSWFSEVGIDGFNYPEKSQSPPYPVSAESAIKYLEDLHHFHEKSTFKVPNVVIELTDDPMTQCSQKVE